MVFDMYFGIWLILQKEIGGTNKTKAHRSNDLAPLEKKERVRSILVERQNV